MQKQAELYRGKAKTVYSTENPDLLVLEFRNDTSAGDGARIEQFDRKGMVNNKFKPLHYDQTGRSGHPDPDGSVAVRYGMSGEKTGYGSG